MAVWPVVEIEQIDGMLHRAYVPARGVDAALADVAYDYVHRALAELDYVGTLAIELFQVGETLLVNEMAPRVHNSGHWTIEGAETSQFENHLRAICGLPLGDVGVRRPVAMVNVIGQEPDPASILAIPGAHLHSYGKQPRPGRKLGHVTVVADDADTVRQRVVQVCGHLTDA